MKVNYKAIEHERLGDAPFVGALISACDCPFNCPNCFNQELKYYPILSEDVDDIISHVKENIFNDGIILGGLEWSLQADECLALCRAAKQQGLKTMVYTGCDYDSPYVKRLIESGVVDYVKCGRYKEAERTANHIEFGVTLTSANQHIYKIGDD
ncbi:MAG: 4Fe-4S cluster-binding domain-containing protein [Oscillospiraceae bacterium]|nr:4Fe-4S cluster-binding domain-containing protein [Oscillospiraceae bacterium]